MEKQYEEKQPEEKYISKTKIPSPWRPPCACGVAMPAELYNKLLDKDAKKTEADK
ncbi:MAG: hypothetical protein QW666_03240 [Candidatus Woesearchaeota archaeon]